jgi:hypothetical protein
VPTAPPASTTTVDKIVEILREESRAVAQQAVAELDSSVVKTFVTLLVAEEEAQAAQAEKKAQERAASAGEDDQCNP